MKRTALFLLLHCWALAALAQVTFKVEAPPVVEVGERFNIVFTVNARSGRFQGPEMEGFIVLAGPSTSTMQRMEMVNGRRTQSSSTSYTYVVEAVKEGVFTIGKAQVEVDKTTYATQPVKVEVVAGAAKPQELASPRGGTSPANVGKEDVFLRLTVNKTHVVKGEPLTATLTLYTRVNIAGMEDVHFPTFNGFWSQEVYSPQNIDFQRENVNGQIYQSGVLRRYVLLPQQTGSITIEPSRFVCLVQVRGARTGSMLDEFFGNYETVRREVASPEVTVKVDPLPAGAPASFTGAVGHFSIEARLSKDSIAAHDAASLYVTVAGQGNINLVEAPKVSFPPDFEAYDTKVTDKSRSSGGTFTGSKIFEYPFIPRSHGDFTVAPVTFTYFDITDKAYKTLTTKPLPLFVARNAQAETSGAVQGPLRRSVKSLEEDIRYIATREPLWREANRFIVSSWGFYLIFFGLWIIFVSLYKLLNQWSKRRKDVVRVRHSKANKMARLRLKSARTLLDQQLFSGFYEEVHRALWGYIGDKLALSQADCSREQVEERLAARHVDPEVAHAWTQLIEDCEFARYAPDPGQIEKEKIFERAIEVISQLEHYLK